MSIRWQEVRVLLDWDSGEYAIHHIVSTSVSSESHSLILILHHESRA
jgi:hypothetical protein